MDCINLATCLHRLAVLGEEDGDAAAFAQRCLITNSTFQWLLENLVSAAAVPEFNSQSVANSLTALAKLHCGSPQLAQALQPPLLRCLQATCSSDGGSCSGNLAATGPAARGAGVPVRAAASGGRGGEAFSALGLSAAVHALAKDWANCKPVFLALRHWILRAVWAAMPYFDPQAVVMVTWSLAEATSGSTSQEFALEADCPGFSAYLAAAGRHHAPAFGLQAVATIFSACGRMRPQLCDAALLQTLCNAALRRWEALSVH